jgi:Ca2+-binding EF-hand superfamily protein
MINSIGAGGSMPPPPPKNAQPLTEEQKQLLTETLSEFDAENLTESDAQSVVKALSEAGIQPSNELEHAIAELGFDAKNIGELAKGEHRPPPPQQSSEEISSISDFLAEMVAEKLTNTGSTELSSEDKEDILSKLFERFDIDEGDSIINTTA